MKIIIIYIIFLDPHPPRFYNCPKDIHVVENTTVHWNEPSYEDNVGIGRFSGPGLSGSILPVGSHDMTYQVWDFDNNKASCVFSINVVQRGKIICKVFRSKISLLN
jgi:WD40 repeat protein